MPRRKKLLIVEDEGLVALDLKNRVEEIGYSVIGIADNMEAAVAAVSQQLPDLALIDIRIQGPHDGIETADRLRTQFDVPAIFVTAYGDTATLERAKLAEPFGYIVKPFVNVDFRAQIEIVLWKHAMEQKLRRSEAWLAAVVHNVGDAVIATDAEGRIAAMNSPAAKLTGWSVEEAQGRSLLEVFSAFDHETGLPLLTPLEPLYQGGQVEIATQRLLLKHRKPESFRLIDASISPNREADKLLGVIVVFRDITERSWAENRDRQLERMRAVSALGGGIGQELRELLNKIASSTGSSTEAERAAWFERANSLAAQIEELGSGEPSAHRAVDLNHLLQKLAPRFAEMFGDLREVKLLLQEKLPAIEADAKSLRKILLATMFELHSLMRRKGRVNISTKASRDWMRVTLTIEDLGKSPKPGPRGAAQPAAQRSGPMLARVHHYMAMEGGELRVRNRSHDGIEGSTLTFVFPVAATALCVLDEGKAVEEKTVKAG